MEQRASYIGTKSDFFTHCMDLPPQVRTVPPPGCEGGGCDGSCVERNFEVGKEVRSHLMGVVQTLSSRGSIVLMPAV
eukprot:10429-Chlamydomonas_euryale.AAC.2